MKYGQPILLVIFLCCILGCGGSHRAEKEKAGDDLQQIKDLTTVTPSMKG